jgi:hypothetical protein
MAGSAPVVNSIIVCDVVIRDRETGKSSLIGIFTRLRASRFPLVHPLLCLYVRLIDAQGDYDFQLALVRLESMEVIGQGTVHVAIPDRPQYHEPGFRLAGMAFPAPGRYELRLYADGKLSGSSGIRCRVARDGEWRRSRGNRI